MSRLLYLANRWSVFNHTAVDFSDGDWIDIVLEGWSARPTRPAKAETLEDEIALVALMVAAARNRFRSTHISSLTGRFSSSVPAFQNIPGV